MFGANCSSGRAVTQVPERWHAEWSDTLQLAQLADEAGIDFMLPIARWKGYGGVTDYEGTSFETITWAAGLLAATKRLRVFCTVHTPLFHPIIASKQMVTADHIGAGRLGLNIVCGWNEGEYDMFGMTRPEHVDRYAQGQEWIDVVSAIWETDDFDSVGPNFSLTGVRVKPKPHGGTRPFVINAALSERGRAFACRNCDGLLTSIDVSNSSVDAAAQIAAVKATARASGNDIELFMPGSVICRSSKREAEEYFHHAVVENADWDAIDKIIELRGHKAETADERARLRRSYTAGTGGSFAPLGDPDSVAAEFARAAESGLAGLAISFVNYLEEFPYFRDEVLPRLVRLGLRTESAA